MLNSFLEALKNNKKYSKSEEREKTIIQKKWFIFRFEFMLIIILGFLSILINEIPNWAIDATTKDPILRYPLKDNLIFSTISLSLIIFTAIFIGVYCEMGGFIGKFGASIFILVPSFLWLFSDRSSNLVEDLSTMTVFLSNILFWINLGLLLSFISLVIFRDFCIGNTKSEKKRNKYEIIFNFVYRLHIILINISMVLLLGISFVNYSVFSLHLADIPGQVGKYDLHSEGMTTFITLVAISFALIMIIIGTSKTFKQKITKEEYEKTREIKIKNKLNSKMNKTQKLTMELESMQTITINRPVIEIEKSIKHKPIEESTSISEVNENQQTEEATKNNKHWEEYRNKDLNGIMNLFGVDKEGE